MPNSAAARAVLELEINECRWPYGDPATDERFEFCRAPTEPGQSYCRAHRAASRRRMLVNGDAVAAE